MQNVSFKIYLSFFLLMMIIGGCSNSSSNINQDRSDSAIVVVDSVQLREKLRNDTVLINYITTFMTDVVFNKGLNQDNLERYFTGIEEIEKSLKKAMDTGMLNPYIYTPGHDKTLALDYMQWRILNSCLSINRELDTISNIDSKDDIIVFKAVFKCGEVFYFIVSKDKAAPKLIAIFERAKKSIFPITYTWKVSDWP